jgi:hypothetical protein
MWYMHDGAPAHCGCIVQDVLSNTYHDREIVGRGKPTAWPPRWRDFNPLDFLPVGTPKISCV